MSRWQMTSYEPTILIHSFRLSHASSNIYFLSHSIEERVSHNNIGEKHHFPGNSERKLVSSRSCSLIEEGMSPRRATTVILSTHTLIITSFL